MLSRCWTRPRPGQRRQWYWTGAGSLTPAALRAAIKRAVMEVNPDQARKRRWTTPSGRQYLTEPTRYPT